MCCSLPHDWIIAFFPRFITIYCLISFMVVIDVFDTKAIIVFIFPSLVILWILCDCIAERRRICWRFYDEPVPRLQNDPLSEIVIT